MPKKSTAARGGAQRNRPKVQRNIELVRPTTAADEQTPDTQDDIDPSPVAATAATADTMASPAAKSGSTSTARVRSATKVREVATRPATAGKKDEDAVAVVDEKEHAKDEAVVTEVAAPKSAAARLAARRQAGQKSQQRTAVALITAEHYSYVRKDLLFIAILALIMFAAIIILHFVPGIGY